MGVDFLAFFVPYVISKIWAKLPQKSKYMKYTDSQRHSTSSFTVDYTTDLELVRKKIGQNADARFRTFLLGNTDIEATLIFAIGSSDKELIEQQILKPLMMDFWIENSSESFRSGKSAIEFAKSRLLFVSELSSAKHLEGLLRTFGRVLPRYLSKVRGKSSCWARGKENPARLGSLWQSRW